MSPEDRMRFEEAEANARSAAEEEARRKKEKLATKKKGKGA